MPPLTDFAGERLEPLDSHEQVAFRELALALRASSWDVAVAVVETAIERGVIPSLASLGTIKQLANLPAFIGGLAMAIMRPAPGSRRGTNPILARLARDHVIEREAAGFSAREIVQEFLLLRRVMWRFVQQHVDPSLPVRSVLKLEDVLNSILDEVIAECTVIYFDRATQELSDRSRRDSLTGLLNHQAFNTRLDDEIDRAQRYGGELQVIYFDLDDFKLINDEQGHVAGDRALVGLASIVHESIRDSDFAGRIGGDEFVIGLVETSHDNAHVLLERLRTALAAAEVENVVPHGTRISAGIAGFPLEADCAQDLLIVADRRLYDDKRARKCPNAQPDPADAVTVSGGGSLVHDDAVEASPQARMSRDDAAAIASPAARAVAHSAISQAQSDVASDTAFDSSDEDETRRVVIAARRAIAEARRRSAAADAATTQN